ncbi:hypothetical protein [Acetobacter papayae]
MRYSTASAATTPASSTSRSTAATNDSFDDAVEPGSAGGGIRQESLSPTSSSHR